LHFLLDWTWVNENEGITLRAIPFVGETNRGRAVLVVRRASGSSPASGSAKACEVGEKALLDLALGA